MVGLFWLQTCSGCQYRVDGVFIWNRRLLGHRGDLPREHHVRGHLPRRLFSQPLRPAQLRRARQPRRRLVLDPCPIAHRPLPHPMQPAPRRPLQARQLLRPGEVTTPVLARRRPRRLERRRPRLLPRTRMVPQGAGARAVGAPTAGGPSAGGTPTAAAAPLAGPGEAAGRLGRSGDAVPRSITCDALGVSCAVLFDYRARASSSAPSAVGRVWSTALVSVAPKCGCRAGSQGAAAIL